MARPRYKYLIKLIKEAFAHAQGLGIPNLLQPGLAKEIVIADILGHEVIISKDGADAHDPANPSVKYEYLSCKEGGAGQFHRMNKFPEDKRVDSLRRIRRNNSIFLAIFYAGNQIKVKTIYQLEPNVVELEAIRQMDISILEKPHVNLSEAWARIHGRVVYQDQPTT